MLDLSRCFVLLVALTTLVGCATVDFDYPKRASYAFTDTSDTTIGQAIARHVVRHPAGQSGFYPVYNGIDALALRLLMVERAERCIDAQYFLIQDDVVGSLFIDALMRAANRGVRVRFLVDDIKEEGYDAWFAALDSLENFEVRVFNPFAHREARGLDVTRLSRITRRMHNKSFTVDNQLTLIGGRNIAGEYFDASEEERFEDLDVLSIGPIVPEVSEEFDLYWNHRASLPMPALVESPDVPEESLETLRARVFELLDKPATRDFVDALGEVVGTYEMAAADVFAWAEYELVCDSPDKSQPETSEAAGTIATELRAAVLDVRRELFIVTPYLVLKESDLDVFRLLRGRGVSVVVLTNSLASNNHEPFHSAYAPARDALLAMGVELHELKSDAKVTGYQPNDAEGMKSTLHTKAFAVDREQIFIGSFNWNQRSANLDTEMGVIIHSPRIAEQFVSRVSHGLSARSYRVFLDDNKELRWREVVGGKDVIHTEEPGTTFWRRFRAGLLRWMPMQDQL